MTSCLPHSQHRLVLAMAGIYSIVIMVMGVSVAFTAAIITMIQIGINKNWIHLLESQTYSLHIY